MQLPTSTRYQQAWHGLTQRRQIWLFMGAAGFIGCKPIGERHSLGQLEDGLENFSTRSRAMHGNASERAPLSTGTARLDAGNFRQLALVGSAREIVKLCVRRSAPPSADVPKER